MDTIINMIGGIALLLWGIRMVRTGINRSFGAELRRALSYSAKNRLVALATGLGVTAAIQSSTAAALMVSSFAGRGMIAGAAALAIMLGADIGSTLVVQVLSLDLRWLSPLLIAFGVILFTSSEASQRRNFARTAIGLGLMLLALKLIMLASAPLRQAEHMSLFVGPLTDEPMLAVLVAALITWAAHSSVAMVLVVVSLASIHVLNLQLAFALVLGANLGGAITAFVATLGAPPAARRVTLGNLLMRCAGVIVLLSAIPWVHPYISLADDAPARMVANFHTAFNIGLALVFLPLVGAVDALTKRIMPDVSEADDPGRPMYLDPNSLDTPAVALACAGRETLRMGDEVRKMLARTLEVFQSNDSKVVQGIEKSDDVIDRLHEAIKLYLTRLTKREMDRRESERSIEVLGFTTNLEHIGDIIDKNLMELAAKKIKRKASFSPAGFKELEIFHKRILANLDLALNVFMSGDLELARKLLREKVAIRDLERDYVESHFMRVSNGMPDSIDSSALHLDVLRDLKRINSHLTSVAYPILERAGELTESRLVSDAMEHHDTRPAPVRGLPETF